MIRALIVLFAIACSRAALGQETLRIELAQSESAEIVGPTGDLSPMPRSAADAAQKIGVQSTPGDPRASNTAPVVLRDAFAPMDCLSYGVEDVRAACQAHAAEYFAYLQRQLDHRSSVFWWQHFFSRLIFVMVVVLVSLGTYFAWRQFHRGEREAERAARSGVDPSKGAVPSISTVELGMTGIKVSSTVLGIIILALSLGFLYLYLVYVFPITEVL